MQFIKLINIQGYTWLYETEIGKTHFKVLTMGLLETTGTRFIDEPPKDRSKRTHPLQRALFR